MPTATKRASPAKPKRQAKQTEAGSRKRGVSEKRAETIAARTVPKTSSAAKKSPAGAKRKTRSSPAQARARAGR